MNDPPLTPLGIEQAKDQALYLKEYLKANEYTDVVIESSPFLRTMQTAAVVAKELNVPRIKLNCLLAKWMRVKSRTVEELDKEFNPFDHLIVNKMEQQDRDECNLDDHMSCKYQFQQKYLNGIEYYNEDRGDDDLNLVDTMEYDFVKRQFPETMDNVNHRVKMVQNQFMSSLKQSNF